MIISASRRTDIPAFFAEELMADVRKGFRDVPHPFDRSKSYRVDLRPEAVDAIVFWTREPDPLLPHLPELESCGYRFYFLYTLLDYPPGFEPNMRPVEERIASFRALADRIGPGRVVWRYDPILVTDVSGFDFHRSAFRRLAERLEGATKRVIVSFYDAYRSTERRLSKLEEEGIRRYTREELFEPAGEETADFLRFLSKEAARRHMRPASCAEPVSLAPYGIEAAPCIDPDLIEEELGVEVTRAKDRGQRKECLCVRSRDIGEYGTCPAGCIYCYASR